MRDSSAELCNMQPDVERVHDVRCDLHTDERDELHSVRYGDIELPDMQPDIERVSQLRFRVLPRC